ncbi:D-alanyl-D-alanine carboxypeptidase [Lactonifactor longoviformis]|uniref:serine-type D-Ala-D-Ala carboxypeptidase n=1 Tax=Lactonifactor longoviformis DSM 17459 TaxID=1122155 RepID=A0A1M5D2E1_9CLOT|nr:D-alanyl-D-alanine carboxypeptidase family protein [Lactonifactor longoviformis]POP31541.1 D-alanyl-D-alanine carboxypeptidase [Lactonifactor longoviformis]SHF61007.1 D-alanyl-D-alanine carboxypeptidase (penicillin-binding protein 5/6) [Lactonifactor longoviformis DSM 17459]
MKRLFFVWITILTLTAGVFKTVPVYAEGTEDTVEEPSGLYAVSAVLMDGDSGRVLFEKNGYEAKPMASTTKIMTCIVALEQGNMEDTVTASAYAASQPKVHLGVREGQQFRLGDLLYSLMLESHNDAAVLIAEHIGGSVEGFADLMNQKARELGCRDTYFITPNGLDASKTLEETDAEGQVTSVQKVHSTTAADLARIMKYCITESPKKEEFLEVTRTASYSFSDLEGKSSYSCNNHNAFLSMMDGALSGKTGFTAKAGYCYVGALNRDGKTFIVALLACGWPNNKGYKWSDTKKLMTYGLDNYSYQNVLDQDKEMQDVFVKDGISSAGEMSQKAYVPVSVDMEGDESLTMLLRRDEQVDIIYDIPKSLTAPVKEHQTVGSVQYKLNGEVIKEYPIVASKSVGELDFQWCFGKVGEKFLLGF